jgi:hypothetical protein
LKPARLATRSCSHSLRAPSAASNCQAGRRVTAPRAGGQRRRQRVAMVVGGEQDLGRVQPRQPARQLALAALGEAEPAAGQAQPGQAPGGAQPRHRQQQRVGALGQQLRVGDGAGRDDAHHLALDRPLGRADVADLLGHRHRLAEADQLGEVALDRVHRHAGHHHRLAAAGRAW